MLKSGVAQSTIFATRKVYRNRVKYAQEPRAAPRHTKQAGERRWVVRKGSILPLVIQEALVGPLLLEREVGGPGDPVGRIVLVRGWLVGH
jgi:hypothetical protein